MAEHLRTSEEMAAYLDVCFEEADSDAAFIAKALGDIGVGQGYGTDCTGRRTLMRESCIKPSLVSELPV